MSPDLKLNQHLQLVPNCLDAGTEATLRDATGIFSAARSDISNCRVSTSSLRSHLLIGETETAGLSSWLSRIESAYESAGWLKMEQDSPLTRGWCHQSACGRCKNTTTTEGALESARYIIVGALGGKTKSKI